MPVPPDVPTLSLLVGILQVWAQVLFNRAPDDERFEETSPPHLMSLLFAELSSLEDMSRVLREFDSTVKLAVRDMQGTDRAGRISTYTNRVNRWFRINIEGSVAISVERRRRDMEALPGTEAMYETELGEAVVTAARRYGAMLAAAEGLRVIFPPRFQQLLIDGVYDDFLIDVDDLISELLDYVVETRKSLLDVGRIAAAQL